MSDLQRDMADRLAHGHCIRALDKVRARIIKQDKLIAMYGDIVSQKETDAVLADVEVVEV